jgi:ketosteroid isomerase-like protein
VDIEGLHERLRVLEDERSILDTLYQYGHSIDYGVRDEWLDCWAPGSVLTWPHMTFTGLDEIAGAFDGHSHAPEAYHKHLLIEPRITLAGDTATVDSYFARVNDSPSGPVMRSFGRYRDVLIRCEDGRWRFMERVTERESLIPGVPVT